NAAAAYQYNKAGLDRTVFATSRKVLERALANGTYRTRPELTAALARSGVTGDSLRILHVLFRAELDGVICSGPRRGRQFTYALLDERVPLAPARPRDEAMAALAERYLTSHGAATIHDFAWWSGLTVADARRAIDAAGSTSVIVGGNTYWMRGSTSLPRSRSTAHLLANYDEFTVAYRDRSAIASDVGVGLLDSIVVLDGACVGKWRRSIGRDQIAVTIEPTRRLTAAEKEALQGAVR